MKRTRLLSVLAVSLLVVLTGCSGSISDTQNTTADTTTDQTNPDGTLDVHFINVGQGASTLIVGPENQTMLIDSGDWSDNGEDVLAYLQHHDIDRIDYLVTTHADADHIGGHAVIIDYYETEANGIGAVYDPGITSNSQTYQNYLDEIEEHNVTLYQTQADDQVPFEAVDATVLAPPEGYLANNDRNENSIILLLRFGQTSFLLPGDGEDASEEFLVDEYGSRLNATVLSAGHHGSKSSTTPEFLDAVRPRITVISSAYDSQYEHPDESVLQRLSDRSIPVYWTATHGNIRLTSNGSAITVATQYDSPTEPLDVRDGTAVEPGVENGLQVRSVIPVSGAPTTATPDGGPTTSMTQTETPDEIDSATPLSVTEVHADADGNDHENLNDEYVVFENTVEEPLEIGGWTVSDASGQTYTVPNDLTLEAGARVTLHTGSGTDSSTDLYWGSGSAIWNNGGDTITVHSDSGDIVLQEGYE